MQTAAFYFLAFVTIFFAIMVVASKNPVYSVLYLVLTFFGISANYIFILDAPFVGIVNIIVYAGAIMVLFLFVIMLMNLNADAEPKKPLLFKASAILAGGMLLVVIGAALSRASFAVSQKHQDVENIGSIKALGNVLYTQYMLPFEVASVLFLVAMIGAVVLAKKDSPVKDAIPETQK